MFQIVQIGKDKNCFYVKRRKWVRWMTLPFYDWEYLAVNGGLYTEVGDAIRFCQCDSKEQALKAIEGYYEFQHPTIVGRG